MNEADDRFSAFSRSPDTLRDVEKTLFGIKSDNPNWKDKWAGKTHSP